MFHTMALRLDGYFMPVHCLLKLQGIIYLVTISPNLLKILMLQYRAHKEGHPAIGWPSFFSDATSNYFFTEPST